MPDYEKIAAGVEEVASEAEVGAPIDPAKLANHKPLELDPDKQREWYDVNHPRYQGLAEAKGYDQSYQRVQALRYSHEAMIDVIVAEPSIKQNELAKKFGHSAAWISRILGSDAFQAALAKRREELTDPFLVATIEERMSGLAMQSLDIIAEKLEQSRNADLAVKALDISSKALGFGARSAGGSQTNQFIIQLPPKAANAADWAADNAPMKQLSGE